MALPTSAKTFGQLQTDVAEALNIAYYGVTGTEVAQPPTETQDADKVKRIINDAIRMFIADAPPQGWNWLEPTAELTLWADVAVDDTVAATGVYDGDTYTVITATEAVFYETMELHDIVVTDVDTYEIASYVSSTQVKILGDHAFADKTFSITADGNYTMPLHFGGEYTSRLSYTAGSGIGTAITWGSPAEIMAHRQLSNTSTGYPYFASVRPSNTARRWELMVFPLPSSDLTVELKFPIHFDLLTATTDYHPAGYKLDDAVCAACLARAQMDVEGSMLQGRVEYYRQVALPNAYRVDARSRPRMLGKMATGRSCAHEPVYRRSNMRVNYG